MRPPTRITSRGCPPPACVLLSASVSHRQRIGSSCSMPSEQASIHATGAVPSSDGKLGHASPTRSLSTISTMTN